VFVISQDSCNVMHEIDGAYVRVSVVGCVSHTLCPLTEQFKLFVCHLIKNKMYTNTHGTIPRAYMSMIFNRFFMC
jgi:hypothetical protein